MEYKVASVSGLAVVDEKQGLVETIVSVTGLRDNVNDIIEPGAYEKSLATRTPKGVWHHNWHESVSRTEDIKELKPGDPGLPKKLPNGQPWPQDAGALKVLTRFNLETQRGREAFSDVVFFGDQQEWSIGYNVPTGGATIDSKTGVRHIKALDLYEYSPVLFGAMPAARTASVKDAQMAYKALSAEDLDRFITETKSFIEEIEDKSKMNPPKNEDEEDEPPASERDQGVEEEELDEERERRPRRGNKSVDLSAAQAEWVQKAIDALKGLLGADGTQEEKQITDDGYFEVKSMMDLLEGVEGAEEITEHAKAFDEAFDADDVDGMTEHGAPILDFVEKGLQEGKDEDALQDIASYVATSFEEKDVDAGDETTGEPEVVDVPPNRRQKAAEVTETKVINFDQLLKEIDAD